MCCQVKETPELEDSYKTRLAKGYRAHRAATLDRAGLGLGHQTLTGWCCSPHTPVGATEDLPTKPHFLLPVYLQPQHWSLGVIPWKQNGLRKSMSLHYSWGTLWNHKEVLGFVSWKKPVLSQHWGYKGQWWGTIKSRDWPLIRKESHKVITQMTLWFILP